ncbi:hypothetical protein V9T40_005519 [Parthenolecanium corni]|uniref:Uncharacterized protein n=1 Tax=Parthenolecanium corni TaxID=536013 RepID=A0AAN9Y4L3_9HEMI
MEETRSGVGKLKGDETSEEEKTSFVCHCHANADADANANAINECSAAISTVDSLDTDTDADTDADAETTENLDWHRPCLLRPRKTGFLRFSSFLIVSHRFNNNNSTSLGKSALNIFIYSLTRRVYHFSAQCQRRHSTPTIDLVIVFFKYEYEYEYRYFRSDPSDSSSNSSSSSSSIFKDENENKTEYVLSWAQRNARSPQPVGDGSMPAVARTIQSLQVAYATCSAAARVANWRISE